MHNVNEVLDVQDDVSPDELASSAVPSTLKPEGRAQALDGKEAAGLEAGSGRVAIDSTQDESGFLSFSGHPAHGQVQTIGAGSPEEALLHLDGIGHRDLFEAYFPPPADAPTGEGMAAAGLAAAAPAAASSVGQGATGNPYIDGLLSGAKWNGSFSYSFPQFASDYPAGYSAEPSTNFAPVTFQQREAARAAMNGTTSGGTVNVMRATYVNSFVGVSVFESGGIGFGLNGSGDIRLAESSIPGTAYAYYPSNAASGQGGDVWFGVAYAGTSNDYRNPYLGGYAYHTLIHEMGHAMGLKHSQELGGVANVAVPSDRDAIEYTVMSYRSYVGGPASGGYTYEQYGAPQTYMMLDIQALQTMYGAYYGVNSGNTVYTWSTTTGETFIDGIGQGTPGANRIFMTVWDGGGIDTYNLSNYASNLNIDLRPGEASTLSSGQLAYLGAGNYAHGNVYNSLLFNGNTASLIENAIGGTGNDTIRGNQANNALSGGAGNDTLYGDFGNDTLSGDGGNDTLYGEFGSDTLNGGDGGDVLEGSFDADTLSGGAGNDLLRGGYVTDTVDGGDGDDTLQVLNGEFYDNSYGGAGTDTLDHSASDYSGSTFDFETGTITGAGINGASAVLSSIEIYRDGSGSNTIISDGTASTYYGNGGNDLMIAELGGEFMYGGAGIDTIDLSRWSGPYTVNMTTGSSNYSSELFAEFENLISGAGNDTITGTAGSNVISTNAGNDTINGGGGADTINAGDGNDTIIDANSFTGDWFDGGLGVDTLIADFTWVDEVLYDLTSGWMRFPGALGTTYDTILNIENLTIGGGADVIGTAGANVITVLDTGFDHNNTINAGAGNDTVNSGIGDDTINAGPGNDTVNAGSGNDTITDTEVMFPSEDDVYNGGTGTDTLIHDFNWINTVVFNLNTGFVTLDGLNRDQLISIENLVVGGNAQVIGSNVDNHLTVNGVGANIISGLGGNDTIDAGGGNDTIDGGAGNDTSIGGAGDDTYLFDTDLALGADTLNESGGGIDTLNFSATTTRSVVVNLANAAAQVVNAGLTLTLGSNATFENVIGGSLADTLTGNALANTITAGAGNDTINAGGGNDTSIGGAGNDTYLFDTDLALGSDTLNESGGGIDTLNFSATTTRSVVVNLANAAAQVVNAGLTVTLGSGTTFENVIGGSLSDTLTGNSLANTITAGAGNDTINAGGGNDTSIGGAGNDSYLFDTDLALGADTLNESGGGIDTLNFSATTTRAVVVNLANAAAQVVNAGLTLTLGSATTVENVIGGSLADTLTGNTLANTLTGGAGNDTINAGGGNDTSIGGAGNDTYLFDTDLALGADTLNESGGGIDTLNFSATTTRSVVVNLSNAAAQVVNAGLTLTLGSAATFENVIGGSLADTLRGNALANTLTGGGGSDTLTGLAGQDTFNFIAALGAGNVDSVADFVAMDDRFLLDDAVFGGIGPVGQLAAANFRAGAAAADASDRIVYNNITGQLFFDSDGTGASAQVQFANVGAGTVVNFDDIWIS